MPVVIRTKPICIDLDTAADLLTLSKSTLESLIRQDQFPKPRQLSARRVGWLLREIEEWAESRPVSELPPPPNTGAKKSGANSDHQ